MFLAEDHTAGIAMGTCFLTATPVSRSTQTPLRHARCSPRRPRVGSTAAARRVCVLAATAAADGHYGRALRDAAGCERTREMCVLVGVDVTTRSRAGARLFSMEDSMAELGRLADTAGMQVVGEVTQALPAPYPGTYIGTGKVAEVRREMEAVGCCTCIFDVELSPAQQRTLEHAFGGEAKGIKVLDRTALILDIFAQHAATREGQLQVELALYQYRHSFSGRRFPYRLCQYFCR